MEDRPVDGGVLIDHQFIEGKHQYEVKSIIKIEKQRGKKYFLRRGDRLRLVNNTEIHDMDPQKLATILSQGNPMLTVHKTIRNKEPTVENPEDEDVLVPFSKEEQLLQFSSEMRRQEDPGENTEEDNLATGDGEDDICTEEGEPTDFLVVTMKKTTISVIAGRSCNTKEPCHECHQTECHYNDIVMVTESSSVRLVPRGNSSLQQLKSNEAEMEHVRTNMFIHSMCAQRQVYVSQNPERITIYYYKSSGSAMAKMSSKGMPVVLNFSGTNCFLKCCQNGVNVQLQVETCEKQRLKSISISDPCTLAYVFYMKSERTRNTTFESALHTGWFIQITDPSCVEMVKTDGPEEKMYFHIIIKSSRIC